MIKLLLFLVVAGIIAYLGSTVPLGKPHKDAPNGRTFFQHISAIWKSDDMTDIKDGIGEKAGPAAAKLKEKIHEATAPVDAAPATP